MGLAYNKGCIFLLSQCVFVCQYRCLFEGNLLGETRNNETRVTLNNFLSFALFTMDVAALSTASTC